MVVGNVNNVSNISAAFSHAASKNPSAYVPNDILEKQIIEGIAPKTSSKLIKLLNSAGRKNGEIVNIIVNNIGTAFVAPIFIALNPFSDQDKDTKNYSAMRQPISAVLAFATQLGINMTFSKFLDNAVSTPGKNEYLDLSMKPRESFVRSQIKKENPGISKDKLAKCVEERTKQITKAAEKAQADKLKSLNAGDLFKQLEINPSELGKIHTKNDTFAKKLAEKLGYKDNKEFIKGISKKGEQFLIDKGFNIDEIKADLKAEQFAEKLGIEKENLATAVEKIKNDGGVEKFLENCGIKFNEELNTQTAEDVLEKIGKTLGTSDILEKAGKAVVNNKILLAESRFKVVKIFTCIGLSLLTLPPTCSLLNWTYPRFMEKFFPNLSNSKKEEGK